MPHKNPALETMPADQEILAYLEGRASAAEVAAMEAALADSAFLKDALEGLSKGGNAEALQATKLKMQARLKEQISPRRKALSPGQVFLREQWIWFALVLVLLMGSAAFWIIRELLNNQ